MKCQDFREIIDYQTTDLRKIRFLFLVNCSVIANVGSCVHHYLPEIGRVGINFLVTGHSRIEANLSA